MLKLKLKSITTVYELDLLKRNELQDRKVESYELINYLMHDGINNIFQYQEFDSINDLKKIEKISNNINTTVGEKERKLIKYVVNRSHTYYLDYLEIYGDDKECNTKKSYISNIWKYELHCQYIFSTCSINGLNYMNKIGYKTTLRYTPNQHNIMKTEQWLQFIILYQSQKSINLSNNSEWLKEIFINLCTLSSKEDNGDTSYLDSFKSLISNSPQFKNVFKKSSQFKLSNPYLGVNNFNTFKWCWEFLNFIELSIDDLPINFQICSTKEIDFIVEKVFNYDEQKIKPNLLKFKSISLINYFIGKFEKTNEMDMKISELIYNYQDYNDIKELVNCLNENGFYGMIRLKLYLKNLIAKSIQLQQDIIKSLNFNSIDKDVLNILLVDSIYSFEIPIVEAILNGCQFIEIDIELVNKQMDYNTKPHHSITFEQIYQFILYLIQKLSKQLNLMVNLVDHLYYTLIEVGEKENTFKKTDQYLEKVVTIYNQFYQIHNLPFEILKIDIESLLKLKSFWINDFIIHFNIDKPVIKKICKSLSINSIFDILNYDINTLKSRFKQLVFKFETNNLLNILLSNHNYQMAVEYVINNSNSNLFDISLLLKSSISIEQLEPIFNLIKTNKIPISNLLNISIRVNKFEIFKYIMELEITSISNIEWIDYPFIIENSRLDFLEYIFVNHLNLFLDIYNKKNSTSNFKITTPIYNNDIQCCILLNKYLPINIFNINDQLISLFNSNTGYQYEPLKYFNEQK